MSNKTQRYQRRENAEPAVETNKLGEGPEIVTGIPMTGDLSPGAPQYAAFEEAAQEAAAHASNYTDPGRIEDRDNRGADEVDGAGKTKARLPIHEIDAMAEEMAASFAHGTERVSTTLEGDAMTVTVVTKHGSSRATANVDDWNKSGVKKALDQIKDKMTGKNPEANNADGSAQDRLATAIRDIASAAKD